MIARVRDSFSDRRIAVVASLAGLSLFVLAMLAARMVYTGTQIHGWLAWNLFLAWIPFVLALLLYERSRAGASWRWLAPLGLLWLAFFPNAPYLVTDLKHLGLDGQVPLLYDVLMLSAAAWLGLLLGLTSLYLVHGVARRFVSVLDAWALVVAALALSSFGIYLGRVQRWNSWDLVAHPASIGDQVGGGLLHPLNHPRPLGPDGPAHRVPARELPRPLLVRAAGLAAARLNRCAVSGRWPDRSRSSRPYRRRGGGARPRGCPRSPHE